MDAIPILSQDEAQGIWEEVSNSLELDGPKRFKTHLLLPVLDDVVKNPGIIHVVCSVLGTEDVLVWSSDWCIKNAHSSGFYSWHQDSTYAGMAMPEKAVTVWLALTPSTPASGCLRVVPSSHKWGQLAHEFKPSNENMLSRGQHIVVGGKIVDFTNEAVDLRLQPGEMSLHSFRSIHASGPNQTDYPRIGFAIRYCAADLQRGSRITEKESAMLVSGVEPENCSFIMESPPNRAMGDEEVLEWKQAVDRENKNYFQDNPVRQTYHR
ncbi:MAG: phytanoyl-CoA dioxygenase family protein [Proteobacteria bacterium]|nr:phytanoyl-CoA dioxygenase family protein [Pseudomonadota bacterium]